MSPLRSWLRFFCRMLLGEPLEDPVLEGYTLATLGPRVLHRGMSGSDVVRLQQSLGIEADGFFGPETEEALRRFQRAWGLYPSGAVGPETRRALGW